METLEKSGPLPETIFREEKDRYRVKAEKDFINEFRGDIDRQWQQSNMLLTYDGSSRVITII
jgi:hypothetical protein